MAEPQTRRERRLRAERDAARAWVRQVQWATRYVFGVEWAIPPGVLGAAREPHPTDAGAER